MRMETNAITRRCLRLPSIRSSANMHTWKLKLMHAIARKGFGSAIATDRYDLDDLSEKMREKASTLCADMLDDVEGPLRRDLNC